MRTLIILAVGLLAVGCGGSAEKKVIGEYEHKDEDGDTHKEVYLENGDYEQYFNGEQSGEFKWSIENKEIHSISHTGVINIFRINKDKSITQIAAIVDGKRTDISKVSKRTWKKIK